MRLALNNAIQSFVGTVILVSHDRHLLRTVCDDLLLVDSGRVISFNQEVDDYPRWLAERKNQKVEISSTSVKPALDKKERKKRDAEFRKTIQPQISRQTRLERSIGKIEKKQTEVEACLADSATYDDSQKEKLKELLFRQADNKRQLDELEMEWFEISEEIEQLRADYDQV